MHDIEPHWNWRDNYTAEEDENSPFFGREYDEFSFSTKIYNYFIHPQWDSIDSPTLYCKLIFANYDFGYAIIELMGEWNDCLHNDIMFLRRNLIDPLMKKGITKFIVIGENVLNFHASDDAYYEDWYEEIADNDGWVVLLNLRDHVMDEMESLPLSYYLNYGTGFNEIRWKPLKPQHFFGVIDQIVTRRLG